MTIPDDAIAGVLGAVVVALVVVVRQLIRVRERVVRLEALREKEDR